MFSLRTFSFSQANKWSRLIVYFLYFSPEISHSFKRFCSLLVENDVLKSRSRHQMCSLLMGYDCCQALCSEQSPGTCVCIHMKTYTLSTSIFIFISLFIENHQFTLMTSIPVQPWGFVLVFPSLYLKFPSPSRRNLALVRLNVFIYLVNPRISCCHTPWPLTMAQCPSPSPHSRFMCLLCLAPEV